MNEHFTIHRKWMGVHPDLMVFGSEGQCAYRLKRDFASSLLNHDYRVINAAGQELFRIRQKNTLALPHYSLLQQGKSVGTMGMFGLKKWYLRTADVSDATIKLDFGLPREFDVVDGDRVIAHVKGNGIKGWKVHLQSDMDDPGEFLAGLAMIIRDYTS